MPAFDTILWGVLVRSAQALVEALPTILCGVIEAGIMRRMIGAEGIRRAFGEKGWKSMFKGWLFGMLDPVCSIGVIPVAREMRRCGVGGGAVVGFLLAAPLLNPISFLYGLTLSEPVVILVFAAASMVLSIGLGELWDYLFPAARDAAAGDEPLPPPGLRRLLAVAVTAGRELVGPTARYCLIAVLGSGLLAAVVPFGSLQQAMKYDDPLAPTEMAVLSLPAFNSPLNGMMKIGLMFDHGNSVGAAFVLFILGLGLNLGLVAWLGGQYGWRRAGVWVGATVAATVLLGHLLHVVLPKPARFEDHTHAFDEYSNPFPSGHEVSAAFAREKVAVKFEVLELASVPMLGVLLVLGLGDRLLARRWDVDGWLARPRAATRKPSRYDAVIPGRVLGVLAFAGLVVFSVVGAYVYYPDRKQARDDLHRLRADVGASLAGARSPSPETAERYRVRAIREIEQTDLAVRKLTVGVYIRDFRLTPEQETTADDLREELEHARDDLLAGKAAEALERRPVLDRAFRACLAAYAPPDAPPASAP